MNEQQQTQAERIASIIELIDGNLLDKAFARGKLWKWLVESLNNNLRGVFDVIWKSDEPLTDTQLMKELDWVFDSRWKELKSVLSTLQALGLIESDGNKCWKVKVSGINTANAESEYS